MHALLEGIEFHFLPQRVENRLDAELLRALAGNDRGRHLMAFIERGGWYGADPFLVWLRRKLDSGPWKDGQRQFSGLTMAQLFDRTGVELSLVASDTTDARMLVLNHRTAPGCPVVWAVRMSMSIPLVWNEVVWQSDWGQYLGRDLTGHLIVDGGVLSNFPIELFISDEAHVVKMMGPKGANPVLGLLIDERLPVPQAKGMLVSVNIKPGELRTVQRLQRLVDTATTAHDKMVIEEYREARGPAAGPGLRHDRVRHERGAPGGARRRRSHGDVSPLRRAARVAAADEGAGRTDGHPRRSAGDEHLGVSGRGGIMAQREVDHPHLHRGPQQPGDAGQGEPEPDPRRRQHAGGRARHALRRSRRRAADTSSASRGPCRSRKASRSSMRRSRRS